jgi:hypothetical protein
MEIDKSNSEWKFVEKKNKKFNIRYWISELLTKIENDKFKLEYIMDYMLIYPLNLS